MHVPPAVLTVQCMESQYINSRPFRVNAGAVHAYVQAPGNKTAYLSELRSGSEVLVADAAGRTRTAVVGRCKVEVRPMVSMAAFGLDSVRNFSEQFNVWMPHNRH